MKTAAALWVLSFCLLSCQKEITADLGPDAGTGGTGTTGDLLVKAVEVTTEGGETDTLTSVFTYDNQKRLETTTIDGTSVGMSYHNYQKYERDAAGRVIRVVQQAEEGGTASDTSYRVVHYPNATTFDCDYSVDNIGVTGISVTDSSVYRYAGGQMTGTSSWLSMPFGAGASETVRDNFSYDSKGRLSVLNVFASATPGAPLSATITETFTYGPALNPNWTSSSQAQNYLVYGSPNVSNEAMTKLQVVSPTEPAANAIVTVSYVVGAGNKPTSSTTTVTGSSPSTGKTTYYYH